MIHNHCYYYNLHEPTLWLDSSQKMSFTLFLTWRKVYLKEVYIQEEKYKDNEEEGK